MRGRTVDLLEALSLALAALAVVATVTLIARPQLPPGGLRSGGAGLTPAVMASVYTHDWLRRQRERATVAPLCYGYDEGWAAAPLRGAVDPPGGGE